MQELKQHPYVMFFRQSLAWELSEAQKGLLTGGLLLVGYGVAAFLPPAKAALLIRSLGHLSGGGGALESQQQWRQAKDLRSGALPSIATPSQPLLALPPSMPQCQPTPQHPHPWYPQQQFDAFPQLAPFGACPPQLGACLPQPGASTRCAPLVIMPNPRLQWAPPSDHTGIDRLALALDN